MLLRGMVNNPDYYFYYEIVPVDKNNDKITQAFFVQMITQAANLFGMESLKVQNLKQRYAQVMGEQFDDIFLSKEEIEMAQQAQLPPPGQEGTPPAGGAPVASGITMPGKKKEVSKMYS